MILFDSHCHLNDPRLKFQLDAVLAEAKAAGVAGFIIPGVVASQWKDILKLGSAIEKRYCTAGLHPLFLHAHCNQDLVDLKQLCRQKRLAAVGEIGLDFYHGRELQAEQQLLFEQQLDIADQAGLPVILHVRKAHNEVLATLRRKRFNRGGCVHAFNGSIQQAMQYIDFNFVIGVGGAITYERATKLRTMVKEIPLNSIVLETDSPDMALSGKKEGPNLPQYLPEVLLELAKLRKLPSNQLAEKTFHTSQNVFRLAWSEPFLYS
jgi:TatD DNase family protein